MAFAFDGRELPGDPSERGFSRVPPGTVARDSSTTTAARLEYSTGQSGVLVARVFGVVCRSRGNRSSGTYAILQSSNVSGKQR